MAGDMNSILVRQLNDRRQRLTSVIPDSGDAGEHLSSLLQEVDSALERLRDGSYGLCESCNQPIEADRLLSDPLLRFCLDHLNPVQQRSLQQDLDLAARIQTGLLPKQDLMVHGWRASYRYRAVGPVSGDYCDLIPGEDDSLYFLLGDVSGKGIAASMLTAHLHAMFRTLVPLKLPLLELVERASRVFCESTLPTHYATLVCGKASADGHIELCNAGHVAPLVIQDGTVDRVNATGLPLGLFCNEEFAIESLRLGKGGTLLLYTDGLLEARDAHENEFGMDRLVEWAGNHRLLSPQGMLAALEKELAAFQAGAPRADDLSLLAIQRSA